MNDKNKYLKTINENLENGCYVGFLAEEVKEKYETFSDIPHILYPYNPHVLFAQLSPLLFLSKFDLSQKTNDTCNVENHVYSDEGIVIDSYLVEVQKYLVFIINRSIFDATDAIGQYVCMLDFCFKVNLNPQFLILDGNVKDCQDIVRDACR